MHWIVMIVGLIGIILGALTLLLSPQAVLIGIALILLSGAFAMDGWRRISAIKKGKDDPGLERERSPKDE